MGIMKKKIKSLCVASRENADFSSCSVLVKRYEKI